jgi:hypothetical protein
MYRQELEAELSEKSPIKRAELVQREDKATQQGGFNRD